MLYAQNFTKIYFNKKKKKMLKRNNKKKQLHTSCCCNVCESEREKRMHRIEWDLLRILNFVVLFYLEVFFFFNIHFEKYIRMSWGDAETAELWNCQAKFMKIERNLNII